MAMSTALLERNLLPDFLIRIGIRRLLAQRLREEDPGDTEARRQRIEALVEELKRSPIAIETDAANEQHYELPSDFFRRVLGHRLKYSSGYWPEGVRDLDAAEDRMLDLTLERAGLEDGQDVLELGCGWGSLTLYAAQRFPASRILAISNSASQIAYIRRAADRQGLTNVEVRRADLNDFDPGRPFDRVVSVEMFEHLRNYDRVLERIASWLRPRGRLFVHIFCHRHLAYPFEVRDESDWMARYFFTGGLMPSADLLLHFQRSLSLDESWLMSGVHYERTSRAWLRRMDQQRKEILPILGEVYGESESRRWWVYWRVFFMACEELFGYRKGEEWMVAHYRFERS